MSSHHCCSPIQANLGDAGVKLRQEQLRQHVVLYANH